MDAPVAAAIVAGCFAAIGWVASYIFTSISNRLSLRRAAAIAHIEKQLGELYGPLAFLVYEGRDTFDELLHALGRDYIFDADDTISDEDLKLWLFWAENDFLPRNLRIKTLLSEKSHLLFDSKMIDSYLSFLHHHNSWMIQHLRWQKEGVTYSWHSRTNWPAQFEEDVLQAFSALQEEHSRLILRPATSRDSTIALLPIVRLKAWVQRRRKS